jgi:hypothetical protein
MPHLYALIKAAEREPVLSHPHAVEGAEMGEGFAGLLGRRPICLLRDSLFRERGVAIRRLMRPHPTRNSRMSGDTGFSEYLCFCFE